MKKALFLCVSLLVATPAIAADTGHCDATPFTLGKASPKPAASAVQPKPITSQAVPKPPKARPEPKSRLLAACKSGKTKKRGS
jgi:hypothetical protein